MIIKKNITMLFLAKLAEAYPIGKVKIAPGTFASFLALIIGYYLLKKIGITNFIIFISIFTLIGVIVSEIHVRIFKIKDPKEVVIDEFSGQFIAILALPYSNNNIDILISLTLSFLLFRFFDITKLGPIKRFEMLPGGIGIMADDVVAGICAFIVQCGIWTYFNQQLLVTI